MSSQGPLRQEEEVGGTDWKMLPAGFGDGGGSRREAEVTDGGRGKWTWTRLSPTASGGETQPC